GVALEEPTAGNLHTGVREGRDLTELWCTYTRTKLETADRAKEDLKSRRFSSTRNGDVSSTVVPESGRIIRNHNVPRGIHEQITKELPENYRNGQRCGSRWSKRRNRVTE